MLSRVAFFLMLAVNSTGVSAAPLSLSLTFVDDYFTEFHTANLDVCTFGDPVCYPTSFDVGDPFRSTLSPFAGVLPGTKIAFEADQTQSGDISCRFADLFKCGFGYGYDADYNAQSDLEGFEIFDFIGDVYINADLDTGLLSFFGAAGSYAPTGCGTPILVGGSLPPGFCDFFGYEALFSFDPDDVKKNNFLIASVPLPAGGLLLISGILALAVIRRRRGYS